MHIFVDFCCRRVKQEMSVCASEIRLFGFLSAHTNVHANPCKMKILLLSELFICKSLNTFVISVVFWSCSALVGEGQRRAHSNKSKRLRTFALAIFKSSSLHTENHPQHFDAKEQLFCPAVVSELLSGFRLFLSSDPSFMLTSHHCPSDTSPPLRPSLSTVRPWFCILLPLSLPYCVSFPWPQAVDTKSF